MAVPKPCIDPNESNQVIANARAHAASKGASVVVGTSLSAAAAVVGIFPVGTIAAAGLALVAGIAGIAAAARKGKAAREATARYWKKKGFSEADEVSKFLVKVAHWSKAKRERKAKNLKEQIERMQRRRVTRREAEHIHKNRLMLAVISAIEIGARRMPHCRLVAEAPETVPAVADTLPQADQDKPDDLTPTNGIPDWLPLAGIGLGITFTGVMIFMGSRPPKVTVTPREPRTAIVR